MISKCSCLAQLRWGTIHGVYYKLVQMDPCSLFGLIIHAVPMGAWSTPWKEASTGVLHEVPHVEPNRVPHEVPPTISRLYSRVSGFVEMCDRPMSISQGAGWDHGLANDTRMGQGLQVPPDRHEEHLQDESGADGWQWHACANCRGSGHHRCLVYQAQADLRGGACLDYCGRFMKRVQTHTMTMYTEAKINLNMTTTQHQNAPPEGK
jgi:hypothetical protein